LIFLSVVPPAKERLKDKKPPAAEQSARHACWLCGTGAEPMIDPGGAPNAEGRAGRRRNPAGTA